MVVVPREFRLLLNTKSTACNNNIVAAAADTTASPTMGIADTVDTGDTVDTAADTVDTADTAGDTADTVVALGPLVSSEREFATASPSLFAPRVAPPPVASSCSHSPVVVVPVVVVAVDCGPWQNCHGSTLTDSIRRDGTYSGLLCCCCVASDL